jgi:hypothetical protein
VIIKSKIKNQKSKINPKIKNFGFWFVILIFEFCILNLNCYAQPISSTELINNAKGHDGKTVVYQGEVIGELMPRGDFTWVNINDGENAIGVWIKSSLARQILYAGSFQAKGDTVEITGAFHRACPEHGADLDIHAQGLKLINAGRLIQERLNPSKRNQAFLLLGVLLLVWILTLLKRR